MRFFLVLFIIVPITEMWLLIEVGAKIGGLPTIGLVFLTAALGLALLRQQGTDTLRRFQRRTEQGQLPAGEIFEGVALAVGGALLLTPGFITDAIGFCCLLPFTRKLVVVGMLHKGLSAFFTQQGGRYGQGHNNGFAFRSSVFSKAEERSKAGDESIKPPQPTIIDGEYKRED